MKRLTCVVTFIAIACLATACERASTPLSPSTSIAVTPAATSIKGTSYVFAKIPAQPGNFTIAPGTNVQAFVFSLDTTGTKGQALAELAFMISGSVQAGNLSNFRIVYYPQGLTKPGTVIAFNDGATWKPGSTPADFLRMRPNPAFALPQNFRGVFALVVDVNAAASPYFFWARLQTANAIIGGVEQLLVNPIEQVLPLQGDTFFVN